MRVLLLSRVLSITDKIYPYRKYLINIHENTSRVFIIVDYSYCLIDTRRNTSHRRLFIEKITRYCLFYTNVREYFIFLVVSIIK